MCVGVCVWERVWNTEQNAFRWTESCFQTYVFVHIMRWQNREFMCTHMYVSLRVSWVYHTVGTTLDTVKYTRPDCIDRIEKHWLSWPTLSRWCWFTSVSSAFELHAQILEILSKIYRWGAQAGFRRHRKSGPVCANLLRTRRLTQDH